MEWQPIETAPKDAFILIGKTGKEVQRAIWHDARGFGWADWTDGAYRMKGYDPTHWMPLPPPPITRA
jgi:hypothetical protein